jgi:hypothetical protein
LEGDKLIFVKESPRPMSPYMKEMPLYLTYPLLKIKPSTGWPKNMTLVEALFENLI